jgi:hypothetical protein
MLACGESVRQKAEGSHRGTWTPASAGVTGNAGSIGCVEKLNVPYVWLEKTKTRSASEEASHSTSCPVLRSPCRDAKSSGVELSNTALNLFCPGFSPCQRGSCA